MSVVERLAAALSDRYRIERELGAGGMATLYLAHDIKHDRDVAVKVLKPGLGEVLGTERFLSDIKVTANLQHPNLLPLFDSGKADGLLCRTSKGKRCARGYSGNNSSPSMTSFVWSR